MNVYGVADQGLISATSLVTLLVVARAVSASAFGAFALAYTLLLIVNGLQSALVTQPHNVIAAGREGPQYLRFTTATITLGILFASVVGVVVLTSALIVAGLGVGSVGLLMALTPASIAWQLQDVTRRILYTEGRLGSVLANDFVAYGGQAVGIVTLAKSGSLDGASALYILALTSFGGVVIGFVQIRGSFGVAVSRTELWEHWHFGKWLAAASASFAISAYFYLYIAALLLGAAAAGELKAAQLVLGPLNVLMIFFATAFPIRLARTLSQGGQLAFFASLKRMFIATAPPIFLYCLLVIAFADPVSRAFFGNRYPHQEILVSFFAAYYFLSYLGQMTTAALNAQQRTRPVFIANLVGAAASLLLGLLFISVGGANGAALGMVASVLLVDLTLANYAFRRASTSSPT